MPPDHKSHARTCVIAQPTCLRPMCTRDDPVYTPLLGLSYDQTKKQCAVNIESWQYDPRLFSAKQHLKTIIQHKPKCTLSLMFMAKSSSITHSKFDCVGFYVICHM